MGEIPLVVINVQRGGPSTGQPTKGEQGDLLTAIFGSHGDAPKVVMAAGTIEDCFYSAITARKIAETFNMVVVVLSDANLATSQQPFPRPRFNEAWVAPPIDQSDIPAGAKPYDWDSLTGLAHDSLSHVAYDPESNEKSIRARSLKLAALQKTLKPPTVFGGDSGDLLVVGWGSTKGAIEEAVEGLRSEGCKVSSLHLTFLQPMAPGIKEIMRRFGKVMTIESNWCDRPDDEIIDETNRRYSALAMLLRARYLVDVDCWSEMRGEPIKPNTIRRVVLDKLAQPPESCP
jgi:2-oxoglutarate ferredoxin oxidoreductase subunit alpha